MANVDLSGADAQRIRSQYRTSLGRDASDDDVSGWLSGTYGGGGTDDWLKQIESSHEAQQRAPKPTQGFPFPPTTQPLPPGGLEQTPPVIGQNPNVSGPQNSSNPMWDQIEQWYQKYLGRGTQQGDIEKWLSGGYGWGGANNLSGIERGIQSSEEASRRRAATPTTSYNAQPYTGFTTGGNDYSAFNTARQQDPGKSAKDAFVLISNQAPPPPFHSKAAMAQWFNTYIRPGMESLGHKVTSVGEDGFTFSNHEGTFFVDFGQNSGAAAGSMLQRLQWLASPADDATRQRYAGSGATASMPQPIVSGAGSPALARGTSSASYAGAQQGTPSLGSSGDPNLDLVASPGWGDFIAQVKPAYQQYLGRDASFEELKNWFTGAYGYGSGVEGLPAILSAIQNSPEARQRGAGSNTNPQTPPSAPVTSTGGAPPSQYSDPHTKQLEEMLQQIIALRMQPVNDPYAAMFQQALQQRANSLGGANKQVDQLMAYLQERFTSLQGPGYTGAENEVIRTQALDPMEQDRSAAKKRVIDRLAARGLTPDSGIYQQALLEVDKAFDAMRGETQGALASNELARREDRAQRAEVIGGQLVDIPEARSREQLDVFSALEQLSQTMRSEEDARSRESLGYAGVLSDLGPQRMQLALQAMGAGGSPESLGNSLFNIAGLNQNAAFLNQRNSGNLWSGLGSIAAILAQSGR